MDIDSFSATTACPTEGGEGKYGPKCQTCRFGPNGNNVCGGCNDACGVRHADSCGRVCESCLWSCVNRNGGDHKANEKDLAHHKLLPWDASEIDWPLLSLAIEGTVEGRPWPLYWIKASSLVTRHGFRAQMCNFRDIYSIPAESKIGLSFMTKDELLEDFWKRLDDRIERIGHFGFDLSLSFNFSSWADAPRMETILNRLRTARSVVELQKVIRRVVVHTEGANARDHTEWATWCEVNRPPVICVNYQLHKKSRAMFLASLAQLSAMLKKLTYSPIVMVSGLALAERAATVVSTLPNHDVRFVNSNCFSAARYYYVFDGGVKTRVYGVPRVGVFEANVRAWYTEFREWLQLTAGPTLRAKYEPVIAAGLTTLDRWTSMPAENREDGMRDRDRRAIEADDIE
jgi:hypothetical protein